MSGRAVLSGTDGCVKASSVDYGRSTCYMCMCTRVILCACVFVCLCVHASSRVFSARACVRIVRRSDKDDDVKVTVTFTLHPTPSAGELE